jgi:hypothetical protein
MKFTPDAHEKTEKDASKSKPKPVALDGRHLGYLIVVYLIKAIKILNRYVFRAIGSSVPLLRRAYNRTYNHIIRMQAALFVDRIPGRNPPTAVS